MQIRLMCNLHVHTLLAKALHVFVGIQTQIGWVDGGLLVPHSPHVHHPAISETLTASVILSLMDLTENIRFNLILYVLAFLNHYTIGSHMATMALKGLNEWLDIIMHIDK